MASWLQRRHETSPRAERVILETDQEREIDPRSMLRPKVLAGVGAAVLVLLLLEILFPRPVPGGRTALQVGQVAREDVVAPFDFDVLKSVDALHDEQAMAEASVVPVFRLDAAAQEDARKRFGDFLTAVYRIRSGPERERQKLDMLGQLGAALSDTTRRVLLSPTRSKGVEERARQTLLSLHQKGVIGGQGAPSLVPDDTVILLRTDDETVARVRGFHSERDLPSIVRSEIAAGVSDRELRKATVEVVVPFAAANVVYDEQETERRREAARRAVSEFAGRDFRKDEVIVHRGERVTEEHVDVLRSVAAKRAEMPGSIGFAAGLPSAGRMLMAALLLGVLVLYMSVRKPKLLVDGRSQGLFLVLVILVMCGAALVKRVPDASEYLVPVAVLSILASMLFDFEIAFVSTVTAVALAALYTEFALPFLFVSLIAGTVAAYSVRAVRHREDFYWSTMRIIAAYAGAIVVADVLLHNLNAGTLARCGWGGLNTLISMGVVVLTLPLFERGFVVHDGHHAARARRHEQTAAPEDGDDRARHVPPQHRRRESRRGRRGRRGRERASCARRRVLPRHREAREPRVLRREPAGAGALREQAHGHPAQGLEPGHPAHLRDGVDLAREGAPARAHHRLHSRAPRHEPHGYFHSKAIEGVEDPEDVNEGDYRYPGPRADEQGVRDRSRSRTRSRRGRGRSVSRSRAADRGRDRGDHRQARRRSPARRRGTHALGFVKIREAFFRVLVGMYHQRVRYPDQEEDEAAPEEP